jgi:hypothetical protein
VFPSGFGRRAAVTFLGAGTVAYAAIALGVAVGLSVFATMPKPG